MIKITGDMKPQAIKSGPKRHAIKILRSEKMQHFDTSSFEMDAITIETAIEEVQFLLKNNDNIKKITIDIDCTNCYNPGKLVLDADSTLEDIKILIALQGTPEVVLRSGEYGMIMFHRLINNSPELFKTKSFSLAKVDEKIPHELGEQYVRYACTIGDNNVSVILRHDPSLDDRSLHPEINPETGFPISSSTLHVE